MAAELLPDKPPYMVASEKSEKVDKWKNEKKWPYMVASEKIEKSVKMKKVTIHGGLWKSGDDLPLNLFALDRVQIERTFIGKIYISGYFLLPKK